MNPNASVPMQQNAQDNQQMSLADVLARQQMAAGGQPQNMGQPAADQDDLYGSSILGGQSWRNRRRETTT